MATSFETRLGNVVIRHKRAVRPLDFPSSEPEDEKVGETKAHLLLRTFLYQMLEASFAPTNSVGSDQYVYWNARDPSRTCAPDAFVKLGVADTLFETWKTWLRGSPDLVVEIASKHDRYGLTWEEKLERFHEMGVSEVIRFDVKAKPGRRLRAWDRIDDDLVERTVVRDVTPCVTLRLHWVLAPAPGCPIAPRLARDPEGRRLLLTSSEKQQAKASTAAARIAELEAELRKRGSK